MPFSSLFTPSKPKELIFRGKHEDLIKVIEYLVEIKYFKYSNSSKKFIEDNFGTNYGDNYEITFQFNNSEEMVLVKLKFGTLFREQ